ncbi:MAG TPA: DUF6049 family protein [Nocardioides sp.]|uniref:DUF6049 family protein n=1 Tax=Nocardioides sp. TaxID=35761 RepID=UPI002CE94FCE|nr:DUF6049 family protein [Nocardioides sp.]HTW16203.1 DUF6049 family protein [Nocardioides sp.]
MLRPLSLLPALVLAATTWVGWSGPAEAAQAARPDDPDAPLSVSIETMSPSTVPDRGPVVLTGRVTNDSDVTWSTINLYPFISAQPLTTRTELVEAAATPPSASVGDRVTTRGPYFTVDELAPGDTAFYTVRVRSADLRAHVAEKGGDLEANAGAYWFGVHALGRSATDAGTSAPTADGRARTFLPRVGGTERQVKTALVVPLRAGIEYDDDGSIAGPAAWSSSLATDGRLGGAVRFGAAAGSRPLTWLIDPALTDVTARLAAGNPGRSLGFTVDPEATEDPDRQLADPEDPAETPPPETETPLPSPETSAAGEDGSDEQTEEEAPKQPTAVEEAAARSATAWRDRLGDALESAEVLALPYGDLDVPAAAAHDPAAYTRARQRSGSTLQPWEVPTSPALGGRTFLDPDSLELAGDDETLLGSDLMVPELGAEAPTVVTVDGRRVVLASTAAASGGPGPDDPLAGVAVRQRILAEAAVRRQATPREPLVVVLPSGWSADDADGFFDGLEQPWLDLTTVADVVDERATELDPAQVDYPRVQERRQLDASVFASARELSEAGTTLQYLLTRNDTVGREVSDQALASLSFASRADPDAARSSNAASREVLEELLAGVRIEAPRQVTLSSASGRFSATLENTLDQPVTVRVRAVAEEPITITMTEEDVTLPPRSRRSVLLTASTEQQGVHNITLQVTDMAGTIVGTSDRLPIRAAQVSNVIWLIIGTGGALLLGAIGVRLARRIRAARRTSGAGEGPEDTRHEAEATEQTPTPA